MKRALQIAVCTFALTVPVIVKASEQSFADLLARAHAQVAAGHKWGPPGDNVNETFSLMIDRLHEATPEQVAEFEAMLTRAQQEAAASLGPTHSSPAAQQDVPDSEELSSATSTPDLAPQTNALVNEEPSPAAAPPNPATQRSASVTEDLPPAAPSPTEASRSAPVSGEPGPPARPEANQQHPAVELASRTMPPAPEAGGVQEKAAPQQKASAPPAAATPAPAAAPSPPANQLATYANDLFKKGKAAEQEGNISGARRYYIIAAEGGHAEAARSAARLYDPNFLKTKVLGGIAPDPKMAEKWYAVAAQLSQPSASTTNPTVSVK